MRLLNTQTFRFVWVNDPSSIDYAILSHVWSEDSEQSFQEVILITTEADRKLEHPRAGNGLSRISEKIRRCCARALADGYDYVWIDSCCIDKSSSAELSEAINSMYKWYEGSSRCYVVLEDVSDDDNPYLRSSQFRRSVWFTRGWTLQELLAPTLVVFLSKDWNPIGTKHDLASIIEQITDVDVDILTGIRSPTDVSVARRMSWAAKRSTTREEDGAYSLLGLFAIHMSTIYGEGKHAFVRLQEEILKQIPDDTLFTWGRRFLLREPTDLQSFDQPCIPDDACDRLFAAGPSDFSLTGDLRPISHDKLLRRLGILDKGESRRSPPTYTTTRFGVRAELPLISFQQHRSAYTLAQVKIGFLLCEDAEGRLVGLILRAVSTHRDASRMRESASNALLVGARIPKEPEKKRWLDHRLVTLTSDVLDHLRQCHRISSSIVHISRGFSYAEERRLSSSSTGESDSAASRAPCSLLLPTWRKAALAKQGITVKEAIMDGPSNLGSEDESGRRHVFELSHSGKTFRVTVDICMRTLCFRMQMRMSAPARLISTEGNMGKETGDYKPVELSSRREGLKSIWEYTLRDSADSAKVQVLRLSITASESPRDLVLILDVDHLDCTLQEKRNSMGSGDSERRQSEPRPEILAPVIADDKGAGKTLPLKVAEKELHNAASPKPAKRQSYMLEEQSVTSRRLTSRIPIRRPGGRRNHNPPVLST